MKIVNITDFAQDWSTLIEEVEAGTEIILVRGGETLARLSKVNAGEVFRRTPGIAADHPSWQGYTFDPAIFAPLDIDEEFGAEAWTA